MRSRVCILIAVSCLTVFGACSRSGTSDEASVRETLNRFVATVAYPNPGELDPEIFGKDILVWWAGSEEKRGRDSVIAELERLRKGGAERAKSIASRAEDLTAHVIGNAAWPTCAIHVEVVPKAEGEPLRRDVRATFAFEKQDERWRIVHEHCSPLHPESK